MFTLKEVVHIAIAIILFAFIINFLSNSFQSALIIAALILIVNVAAKEFAAYFHQATIEHKIWQFQRWGYYERSHLKRPIPAGIIFPFLLLWVSYPYGFLKMLTFIQSDIKATTARVAKKRGGLYRFSEMSEWHIGLICGAGIFANLILVVIGLLIGDPISIKLADYSIYYVLWNLIPFGQLDGAKIFFGSKVLWPLLAILSLIGLFFILFIF